MHDEHSINWPLANMQNISQLTLETYMFLNRSQNPQNPKPDSVKPTEP